MSQVTDIILVTAINDGGAEDEHPNVDMLNGWLKARHRGAELVKIDHHAGGNKYMQCDLWAAAINYNDDDALIRDFPSVPWEAPEMAQLMIKREQDDRFDIYQLTWDRGLQILRPEKLVMPAPLV